MVQILLALSLDPQTSNMHNIFWQLSDVMSSDTNIVWCKKVRLRCKEDYPTRFGFIGFIYLLSAHPGDTICINWKMDVMYWTETLYIPDSKECAGPEDWGLGPRRAVAVVDKWVVAGTWHDAAPWHTDTVAQPPHIIHQYSPSFIQDLSKFMIIMSTLQIAALKSFLWWNKM